MYLKLIIVFLSMNSLAFCITREQLQKSGNLIKKACLPKHNVTEEQVNGIAKGNFEEDRELMCFISCVFTTSRVIKNRKIHHDTMIKQVDMMFPDEMKDPVKAAIDNCRDVAKQYTDICDASYWTAKCMYDFDSDNFVFA